MTSPANPTRETAEQRIGPEVKRLRDQAGLSVRALAERAGFSASFISQVENGLASPSISSLERMASALNVGIGDFFGPTRAPDVLIVKADERPRFYSSWSRAHVSVLTPGATPDALRAIAVTLQPGGTSGHTLSGLPVEQFALVVDGTADLGLDGDTHHLQAGDAVSIPARVLHRWSNESASDVQIVVVSAAD